MSVAMKIVAIVMVGFVCRGLALDCFTYVDNSYEKNPQNASVQTQTCGSQYNWCATLGWTSALSDGEHVEFKQGLCATQTVCHNFCRALYADPTLGKITSQCQHQCCNQDSCNNVKK